MADPYIDQVETIIYGRFMREQVALVCLGLVPDLDGLVRYTVARQEEADRQMKAALDAQPRGAAGPGATDAASVIAEARDVVMRFASHLASHKGRPFDVQQIFGHESPSVLARRRLTKLVGGIGLVIDQLKEHKESIREWKLWHAELVEVYGRLRALEATQRRGRLERVMAPEVAAARLAWLEIYGANKQLLRGLLAHAGRPELMPLVFDDLAEVHRTTGTSDTDPGPVEVIASGNGAHSNGAHSNGSAPAPAQ